MRRFLLLAAIAAAPLSTGCGLCGGAKPGFSFAWQMPPTLNQAAILGPQVTTFGAQGLACGPTQGALGLYSADANPASLRYVERMAQPPIVERYSYPPAQAPAPMSSARAPVPDCTLDEVCRMLIAISKRLDQIPTGKGKAMSMPMPKAGGAGDGGEGLEE